MKQLSTTLIKPFYRTLHTNVPFRSYVVCNKSLRLKSHGYKIWVSWAGGPASVGCLINGVNISTRAFHLLVLRSGPSSQISFSLNANMAFQFFDATLYSENLTEARQVSLRSLGAITLLVFVFRSWNFLVRPFFHPEEFPVLPYWIPCTSPIRLVGDELKAHQCFLSHW